MWSLVLHAIEMGQYGIFKKIFLDQLPKNDKHEPGVHQSICLKDNAYADEEALHRSSEPIMPRALLICLQRAAEAGKHSQKEKNNS